MYLVTVVPLKKTRWKATGPQHKVYRSEIGDFNLQRDMCPGGKGQENTAADTFRNSDKSKGPVYHSTDGKSYTHLNVIPQSFKKPRHSLIFLSKMTPDSRGTVRISFFTFLLAAPKGDRPRERPLGEEGRGGNKADRPTAAVARGVFPRFFSAARHSELWEGRWAPKRRIGVVRIAGWKPRVAAGSAEIELNSHEVMNVQRRCSVNSILRLQCFTSFWHCWGMGKSVTITQFSDKWVNICGMLFWFNSAFAKSSSCFSDIVTSSNKFTPQHPQPQEGFLGGPQHIGWENCMLQVVWISFEVDQEEAQKAKGSAKLTFKPAT